VILDVRTRPPRSLRAPKPSFAKLALKNVSRFVAEQGGLWIGTPIELHQQGQSDYKLERADELSKFIKEVAEDEEDFIYRSDTERYKDEDTGEWKTKRMITLFRNTA
jgi:hypothetical protein